MRDPNPVSPDPGVPVDPMGIQGSEDLARINRATDPILDENHVDVTLADRSTPPSGLTSGSMIFPEDHPPPHEQIGVSPGNADAESFDWDHLGG